MYKSVYVWELLGYKDIALVSVWSGRLWVMKESDADVCGRGGREDSCNK